MYRLTILYMDASTRTLYPENKKELKKYIKDELSYDTKFAITFSVYKLDPN